MLVLSISTGSINKPTDQLALLTFTTALLGVFVKDIAILLFATPALLESPGTIPPTLANVGDRPDCPWSVVIVAYSVLSLLPSLYAQTSAFRSDGSWLLEADWRFYILLGFCSLRFGAVLMQNRKPVLLDGLNLAALLYAFALLASVGYPFDSFWTLPVQLVTAMDLGYIWCRWIHPHFNRWPSVGVNLLGVIATMGLITFAHSNSRNFSQRVATIKAIQTGWHSTYLAMKSQIETTESSGKPVNIIIIRSYFNRHTLKQLKADRLIEYHRGRKTYTVVNGIDEGKSYTPRAGDFAHDDKRERKDLDQDADQYDPFTFTTLIFALHGFSVTTKSNHDIQASKLASSSLGASLYCHGAVQRGSRGRMVVADPGDGMASFASQQCGQRSALSLQPHLP